MSFANLFTFERAYSYNAESFAYTDCKLIKDVSKELVKGAIIPEALVNFKTSKIKFNVDNKIYTLFIDVAWSTITSKDASANDSDFDCEDDDNDDTDSNEIDDDDDSNDDDDDDDN